LSKEEVIIGGGTSRVKPPFEIFGLTHIIVLHAPDPVNDKL
jgi:hypothetical protein